MKQVDLSWEWFEQSTRALAQRCRARAEEMPLEGIIVLGRGGMTVGTRLTHLLGVPLCGAVLLSRYAGPSDGPEDPPVDGVVISPRARRRRGRLLLVDNIISEGVSLNLALEALRQAGIQQARLLTCALLARGDHAPEGIIGARVPDPETWYVFPWEVRIC